HLPATKGAVPFLERPDANAPQPLPIEVRMQRRRRLVAPGVAPFFWREAADPIGDPCGGNLPFELGGKPTSHNGTVSPALDPFPLAPRTAGLQLAPSIEVPALPRIPQLPPVHRPLGSGIRPPAPSIVTPESALLVPSFVDESSELRLSDR